MFRQETSVKYPTFTSPPEPAPPTSQIAAAKLAQAFSPIPVRHHYDHDETDSQAPHGTHPHSFHPNQQQNMPFRPGGLQPATPAPSPPPSPKPKKQQYQTDQNRPFLFPFSRSRFGRDAKLVPFAIDEADKLYNKHMYVSLSIWQMWRAREECMSAESGLQFMPGSEGISESSSQQLVRNKTACGASMLTRPRMKRVSRLCRMS
jgi:hypothetical protein